MQATEMKVVSRSQTTFQGKGSGTMPMRHLCRDLPELGGGGGGIIAFHTLTLPGNRPPTTTGVAQAAAKKAMIRSTLSF